MKDLQVSFTQASQFIKDHDHFLVVSHVQPDGDATGSVMAVATLLQQLGKSYHIVNEGKSPRRFSFLAGFEQIRDLSQQPLSETFEHIIAVDVADEERLGKARTLFDDPYTLLNIDHHPTNTRFGDVNVIAPQAASTTQILYNWIRTDFASMLNKQLAEALYTGLFTDTGGFRYSNTTHEVLQMAAELLAFDVQPAQIAEESLEKISKKHLHLLQQALQTLSYAYDDQVAVMSISRDEMEAVQADEEDISGLVSYPRKIQGVEVGVMIKEVHTGEVKVSLRSTEKMDVGTLAQSFGGGGHARASGFTYYGSIAQAKEAILQKLQATFG